MMSRWRLRTKFLLWMVLISATVTAVTLLLVRRTVGSRLRAQIVRDLHSSVSTFKNVQRQRQDTLQHVAQLVANLPISRALMTTNHPPTIQDGSGDLWRLAGTDLLAMSARSGAVMGLRSRTPLDANEVSRALQQTHAGTESWWLVGGHLFEVSVQPIYFGAPAEERTLGFLAVGSDIDERVAQQLGEVAGIEVAFRYGDHLVRSTLSADKTVALASVSADPRLLKDEPLELQLGSEPYLVSSVALEGESASPVRLVVLKSLTDANAVVQRLDSLLLAIGLTTLIAGSLVVSLISRAFTTPLERLVAGVRALGVGDYEYPLPAGGNDEVAELTSAFARMRASLRESQRELLQSERLATIGRMASSISHDLRHHLVAILANAEYLMDDRVPSERQELYDELKHSVAQMTDMIESLLELSRPREALRPSHVSVKELVERVAQIVRAYPQFCTVPIEIEGDEVEAWFDPIKLHRVIQNLLVNACEAVPALGGGRVAVSLAKRDAAVEIRVTDNGRGIPEEIRHRIFEAFVSYGKENGTGLGLTVVRKLVQDHEGTAAVESTGMNGTVMLVTLPLATPAAVHGDDPPATPFRSAT